MKQQYYAVRAGWNRHCLRYLRVFGIIGVVIPIMESSVLVADGTCWHAGDNTICCPTPPPRDCVSQTSQPPASWPCPDLFSGTVAITTCRAALPGESGKTRVKATAAGICERTPRTCSTTLFLCDEGMPTITGCANTVLDTIYECAIPPEEEN